MIEQINHPTYYGGDTTYEAIKVIEAWRLGFCLGNTVKYIARAEMKGSTLADLKKARWYLDREITRREQNIQVAAKVADYQASIKPDMRLSEMPEVQESGSRETVLAEVGQGA